MSTTAGLSRVDAGTAAGGQFTSTARAEPDVELPDQAPRCELCAGEASTRVQARGPVGPPRYACTEHSSAPTFSSFGGGWVEQSPVTS
ncbi:hypothetical protein [Oerskovia enterophila]|uniref:Uncharacterized protein n=1 Tax=Oerskovia enterophila TaxID=43678 RepID=A0ABX2Y8E2_9CELL|nr:hypothetical protein [Oerskovia enterophila]OCI32875.1 hypothetical protein OERS_04670 [Oerskovia enterophila]